MKIHKKSKPIKKSSVSHRQKFVDINKLENISAWDRVQIARQTDRPTSLDYIDALFENFFELSGDRVMGDDKDVIAGKARFNGRAVTVIGNQKGKKQLTMQYFEILEWLLPKATEKYCDWQNK